MSRKCCCGCPWCTGTKPTQLSVTLAGITNRVCSTCNDFNDTYILDLVNDEYGPCHWRYETETNSCGYDIFSIDAVYVEATDTFEIWVFLGTSNNATYIIDWTDISAPCSDLEQEIANDFDTLLCNHASSTATVAIA